VTRILLVGRTGQVGSELVSTLAPLGTVTAPTRSELDLSRPDTIPDFIRALRPSIIVNAGAYTAVDKAEREPDLAHTVNAAAPGALAHAAREAGALMVHYSTDYVFDGTRPGAYAESDATHPLGVYGRTKLEGELAVARTGAAHLILRTSWVYGATGTNFLRTMLRLAAERDELRVVGDQIGAPTWSHDIARATATIIGPLLAAGGDVATRVRDSRLEGIYHLTAAGSVSWYHFAEAIFDAAPLALVARRPRILPISTAGYGAPAPRPANSRLSHIKLEKTFGLRLPHWRSSLAEAIRGIAAIPS
jgi:dTDP-4-dehydrorhamnose reductase